MSYAYARRQHYDRTTVDKVSGEKREEEVTQVVRSGYAIDYRAPYGTLSDAAWELMDIMEFTSSDRKLFGHLIRRRSRTEHGMVRTGPKNKLAADVGMNLRTLHRAFAMLEKSGLIYPVSPETWMLNPRWLFNGGGEAHHRALQQVPAWVPDLFHLTSYGRKNTVSSWDGVAPGSRSRRHAQRAA
ncbi:hypothetical protein ACIG3E_11250 [Streptomyces sp. NPDC053474]|uniref:hypothetical protein n=1 Tax=Streptomyces sp. NPDC053474 TaxID=3365704 RepID=UPI0037D42B9B